MKKVHQLEEKIRIEVIGREQITKQYELAINSGGEKLNNETTNLSDSPLVREISLLVAAELLRNGQTSESLN